MALTKISKCKMFFLENKGIYYYSKEHCEICNHELWITHLTVHHLIPIRIDPSRKYDMDNMILICNHCHEKIHPENKYIEKNNKLQHEVDWLKTRIYFYENQIEEMTNLTQPRYFEKYKESTKRLQKVLKYLQEQKLKIHIPKEWNLNIISNI